MFITIEGGEGAGKTTLIALLAQLCEENGRPALLTREPGGIPIAEAIRSVVLDTRNTSMDARTEALLYAAARRQHLVEKVMPALSQGAIVSCDRFVDSSLAYQGYARGLGFDQVWEINRFATQDCMPELTLFLDIAPGAGLARIHANAEREINRLDLEGLAFHKRVREGYQEAIRRFPDRIVTLDASLAPERIAEAAWKQVSARLRLRE